jgi:hypothetical protein
LWWWIDRVTVERKEKEREKVVRGLVTWQKVNGEKWKMNSVLTGSVMTGFYSDKCKCWANQELPCGLGPLTNFLDQ